MSDHDWISEKARARPPGDPLLDHFTSWLRSDEAASAQAAADQKLIDTLTSGKLTTSTLQDLLWTPANVNRMVGDEPFLHRVVRDCDLSTLILLISCKNKVALDDVDAKGRTAVDLALENGWSEKAHYLVLYGGHTADELPDFLGKRETSNYQMRVDDWLKNASYRCDADVARRALRLGADANCMHDTTLSMFHRHALMLQPEMARVYLEAGADITRRHSRGEDTLELMWWVNTNRLSDAWYDMIDLLRAFSAPPENFKTPREMTVEEMLAPPPKGFRESPVVDYLLQAGDWARVTQVMAAMTPDSLEKWLLKRSEVLGAPPADILCYRDRLDLIFNADLWRGSRGGVQRVWQSVADSATRPMAWRDNKPASYTPDAFAKLLRAMALDDMRTKRPRIVWKNDGPSS